LGLIQFIMKKLLFIFIAFLPVFSMAQAVDHFASEDSEWYTASVYPNPSPEDPYFVQTKSTHYGFIGDTVINNEIWLKLYSSWDTLFNLELHFQGFIHSDDGIVLFQKLNYIVDTLYNFNLNVGDSVYFNLSINPQNIAINNIDSIQINGNYFKRFFFDEPSGPIVFDVLNEIWIEGIGSLHGPLFPNQPRKFATEWPDKLDLTCSFSEGIQYWNNPSYNDCFINIILGLDDLSLTGYNIYPNPFKDFIIIENSNLESKNTDVDIFSTQGRKVSSVNFSDKKQRIILDYLPIGVYYIRINQNGSYKTKVVVKLY